MISTTLAWILTLTALAGLAGFVLALLAHRRLDALRRELDVRNWYRDRDLPEPPRPRQRRTMHD